MAKNKQPCCAAEALRRIRPVEIGGIVVGLAMLDAILDEVCDLHLTGKDAIADELLKRVQIYNYVPKSAEAAFRTALLREYEREVTE